MNGELFTDAIRKFKLEVVNVQFLKYVLVVANPVYNGCSTGKRMNGDFNIVNNTSLQDAITKGLKYCEP
jgi:hypothetical protein